MTLEEKWKAGIDAMQKRNLTRSPERNAYHSKVAEEALEFFGLRGRLLDVGCGDGQLRHRLRDVEYHGADVVPIDRPQFPFAKAEAEELPFPDERFDCVLAYSVLQHVGIPHRAIAEMTRVTRPGGKIALLTVVESEDPIFVYHWQLGPYLTEIDAAMRLKKVLLIPGMYPEDGRYVATVGARP